MTTHPFSCLVTVFVLIIAVSQLAGHEYPTGKSHNRAPVRKPAPRNRPSTGAFNRQNLASPNVHDKQGQVSRGTREGHRRKLVGRLSSSNEGRRIKNFEGKRKSRLTKERSLREYFKDGDPDEGSHSGGRRVARIRSGNFGLFRLATPSWFQRYGIYSDYDTGRVVGGSFIVLADNIIMIDRSFRGNDPGNLGKRYQLSVYRPAGVKIIRTSLPLRDRNLEDETIELIASLRSGFDIFRVIESNGTYSSRIKWQINTEDEDDYHKQNLYKQNREGCFRFKYTTLDYGVNDFHLVNSEVPVKFLSYDSKENYYTCDEKVPPKWVQKFVLDTDNNGSPVFCGDEGKLKFFSRGVIFPVSMFRYHQLIPLKLIAQQIKQFNSTLYDELVVELPKRHPGSSLVNPPNWYRGLYRSSKLKENSTNNNWKLFGGNFIMLDSTYFIVHEKVEAVTIHAELSNEENWEYYHSETVPLPKVADFTSKRPRRIQPNQKPKYHWPNFQVSLSGMMLYRRSIDDNSVPPVDQKFNLDFDYSDSQCHLLLSRVIRRNGTEKVVTEMILIKLVPHSCSRFYCYFIYDDHNDKQANWQEWAPIMCDSKFALLTLEPLGRSRERGLRAMTVYYLLELIRSSQYELYSSLVINPKGPNEPSEINAGIEYTPRNFLGSRWLRPMLHNAPLVPDFNGRDYLGYAGLAIALSDRRFLVSDYVANNALFPSNSKLSGITLVLNDFHDKEWMVRSDEFGTEESLMEIPNYSGKTRLPEDKLDWPRREIFIRNHAFTIYSRDSEFGNLGNNSYQYRDLGPEDDLKSMRLKNETCYAVTYTPKGDKNVLTQVPVFFERCDKIHCYVSSDWSIVDPITDLSKSVYAGAPIICRDYIVGFNDPYPDQLNRAIHRVLRPSVMMKEANRKPDLGEIVTGDPPLWYRNVLSQDMISRYNKEAYVPPMIVLSPNYYVGSRQKLNVALNLSISDKGQTRNWALFYRTDQPTPPNFLSLYDLRRRNTNDEVIYRLDIQGGLDIFTRKAGYERLGYGLDKLYKPNMEPMKDCYAYLYKSEPIDDKNYIFRFLKTKVEVIYCENNTKICLENSANVELMEVTPIVCAGVLSYLVPATVSPGATQPIVRMTEVVNRMKTFDMDPLDMVSFIDPPEEIAIFDSV